LIKILSCQAVRRTTSINAAVAICLNALTLTSEPLALASKIQALVLALALRVEALVLALRVEALVLALALRLEALVLALRFWP